MASSRLKKKRNLAIPGEAISQAEFEALIKEAEKGPFKPIEGLKEDVLNLRRKKYEK
jgi:hypothetical protein